MFLEVGYKPAGMYGLEMKQSKMFAEQDHHRAAQEFVLELTSAGSPRAPRTLRLPENKRQPLVSYDALVQAEDIPVPMFAVDLDMRCVLWNKRAAELTGWTEAEILSMPKFTDTLFSTPSSSQTDCEDVLKAALEGQDCAPEVWTMKTERNEDIKVQLFSSARTNNLGAVCGALCVIVALPLNARVMQQPTIDVECNTRAIEKVRLLDIEENQLNIDDDISPRGSEDQFLAAIEQPPSPYSDDGLDAIDMFGDPGSLVSEEESTSVCSQDWCKSEQSSQTLVGSGSGLGPSGLTRARVMVVDPVLRSRKSLKLMLERCGFDVSCALSGSEALWRFEQSLQDPEGYSVIFVNLSVARHEDYNFVHEIRAMEQDANLSSPSLIVAVTDLDRWDIASGREASTQKDVAAGVDAVINCPSRVQQLRDTLATLGVSIDHLDFANKSPRSSFNSWNNPLILAR